MWIGNPLSVLILGEWGAPLSLGGAVEGDGTGMWAVSDTMAVIEGVLPDGRCLLRLGEQ